MAGTVHNRSRTTQSSRKAETENGIKKKVKFNLNNNSTEGADEGPTTVTQKLLELLNRTLIPMFLIITTPFFVLFLWYSAVKCNGSLTIFIEKLLAQGISSILSEIHLVSFLSMSVILGYCCFAVLLQVAIPGPRVEGQLTPKGNTPVYKDNGFFCFLITLAAFFLITHVLKMHQLSPTVIYDHFDEFLGTLTLMSQLLCVCLYFKGLRAPSTSDSGSSGNPLFDFYWGTELYPRIYGVDIKVFTNCRFGMTVWPLLCLIFSLKSYELHGFVDSIWVSCTLQMIYFFKFFWWEAGYMRTIDIMVDRAGYYICWGCMVWIPGLYASVCMFLVNQPVQLGPQLSYFILISGIISIFVNYFADRQKQEVRRTDGECLIWGKKPDIIRAKYQVEDGKTHESILLASGFWGVARHFHYVPELTLAFLWSVPGLTSHLLLYSYFIFLFILLVHRTFRDDIKCHKKYGSYWEEYCKKVPYKMIPGIF